ncbi:MAG: HIT domain-containing protein, partial [Pseudomonadales bacterium]|nr:HIT domain-containing protein [Pseudomonadales bacterium]
MAYDPNNIFAKILRGEAPAFTVYENEHALALMDVMPQGEGHALVITKAATANLQDANP